MEEAAGLNDEKAVLSSGFMTSKGPGMPMEPFFFFDLEESFRFRVWIPSFFIVSGRFTYLNIKNRNTF